MSEEIDIVERIANIARLFMKRFAPLAAAAGISMTEGLVLWKVYHKGSIKASAIASHMGLPPSTLTGILDRLVEGGWLLREADPSDRRAVLMQVTPKLKEYMKTSRRTVTKGLEKTFKDLPPELLSRLSADLGRVLEALEAEEKAKR
jgi:DNA-binding MarR family transcriptional regulator